MIMIIENIIRVILILFVIAFAIIYIFGFIENLNIDLNI